MHLWRICSKALPALSLSISPPRPPSQALSLLPFSCTKHKLNSLLFLQILTLVVYLYALLASEYITTPENFVDTNSKISATVFWFPRCLYLQLVLSSSDRELNWHQGNVVFIMVHRYMCRDMYRCDLFRKGKETQKGAFSFKANNLSKKLSQ